MYKIKDFALQSGFSIRMLRYLEDMDILIPSRTEKNYRLYSESLLPRAQKIKALQSLGLQLWEIREADRGSTEIQLAILEKVLLREKEIAEIKSGTVPRLLELIESIRAKKSDLFTVMEEPKAHSKKYQTGGGKFQRTMYSIPALKEVYEEHIAQECQIELISTDFAKFKDYLEAVTYTPEVYSIFKESTFSFGHNLRTEFLMGYEKSWHKFFKSIDFKKLEGFQKKDMIQLMGAHDLVIRTDFKYTNGETGEIVIPYTPIFMLSV